MCMHDEAAGHDTAPKNSRQTDEASEERNNNKKIE